MRLLRLDGESPGDRSIDLHPGISVVTDLDDDLRGRLLRACQALPAADEPGCDGLVEAHGVLFDLGIESLDLMGLDEPLNVVMDGDDDSGRLDESDRSDDQGPSAVDVFEKAAAELRALRGELDRAQPDVLAGLEAAREVLDPFARTAYEQARADADRVAGLTEAEQLSDDLEDPGPLRERLAKIERIDREMEDVDAASINAAFEVAIGDDPVAPEVVEAGRLAVELRQNDTELADLDSALETRGLHPVELARSRDALSVEVASLEAEHAPRDLDPVDRVALEAAHDDVLEAQKKVSGSLLGGRNADRRLEIALEAQEGILDRVGLPTYAAFVMAVTVGGVDPGLERRLHAARKDLAAGQADLEAATDLLEHDPAWTTLSVRHEEITARATELLGRDPGPDVVGELLAFKERHDESDPVDELRHRMEREGVLVPGLDLVDSEVCDFAAAWIEQMTTAAETVDERTAEIAELRDRIAGVEQAQSEADDKRSRAERVAEPPELVAARERLDHHEVATARVAELTELLQDTDRRRHEIEARLEAQEAVADLARSGSARREGSPDRGDRSDEVRARLKARLVDHRDRSVAGAVPMVIRDVFGGFDRDVVSDLLSELANDADGVQVIILDDDLPVVTWATSVGFQTAAVVSPE